MSNPENYHRSQELRDYVRGEIEDLNSGKIPALSNFRELRERFGYNSDESPRKILISTELFEARELAKKNRFDILTSSTELAWIIGVLSGGGYVKQNGEVSVRSDVPRLLDAFKHRGETIFGIARSNPEAKKSGDSVVTKKVVAFYNVDVSSAIGDLSRDNWPTTVTEKHRWILEHGRYSWKFIEGFFEKRGSVYGKTARGTGNDMILLSTSSTIAANFLAELCVRLGIENPTIRKYNKASEGIRGLVIRRSSDMHLLSNNIFPVSPDKEVSLARLRGHVVHKGRERVHSDQEVVDEWIRLKVILGHIPNYSEAKRLKQEGIARFSPIVFARLGEGSFARARENIEELIKNSDETANLR